MKDFKEWYCNECECWKDEIPEEEMKHCAYDGNCIECECGTGYVSKEDRDKCCNDVTKDMCLCRKCLGECYVSTCDRKIQIGGMCGGIGTVKCDEFQPKLI
jgi:hypothetical protein